jgi:sulfur carrier protein ThiS
MRILFINNDGGGFADYIDVPAETTVQTLFSQQISYGKPEDYLIRVNRQPVTRDQVLQEGDRITITPVKIEGAVVAATVA